MQGGRLRMEIRTAETQNALEDEDDNSVLADLEKEERIAN